MCTSHERYLWLEAAAHVHLLRGFVRYIPFQWDEPMNSSVLDACSMGIQKGVMTVIVCLFDLSSSLPMVFGEVQQWGLQYSHISDYSQVPQKVSRASLRLRYLCERG